MSGVDRKLTTILATDVVAFSNMMSRDEPGALHALKTCLGKIEDCIREHNGRVFGGAGDSLIAEFSSPNSAVLCAVDFQNKIAARNRDCLKQQRMWFRVGINLGDVMIDGENLFGEGVNIASRLEELGEPAGVCISHKVYEEVQRNLALTFVDSGKRDLKNIDLPVHVYHFRPDDQDNDANLADYRGKEHRPVTASPKPAGQPVHTLALRDISVAGGEEAEFLAEGLRDGLLNSLSRDSEIGLIREQSTAGQDADFILKGSVRGRADRLRLTFSLIESANGTQVWSERYDRKSGDIFDLEEEISRAVAAAIRVKLKDFEFEWLRNTKDEELSVADLLRKGAAFFAHGPGENDKISASLRAALAREPDNSMAMAMLAFSLHRSFEYSPLVPRTESINEMKGLAEAAVKLKPDSYFAHLVVAILSQDLSGDFERARRHAEAALDANPDLLGAHGMVGVVECHLGEVPAGIAMLRRVLDASRIDPHRFRHQRELAVANCLAGNVEAAAEIAGHLVESDPQMERNRLVQGALLWLSGNIDAATDVAHQLRDKHPGLTGLTKRSTMFGRTKDRRRFEEAYEAIGLGSGSDGNS